jgi:hypothetical protein
MAASDWHTTSELLVHFVDRLASALLTQVEPPMQIPLYLQRERVVHCWSDIGPWPE